MWGALQQKLYLNVLRYGHNQSAPFLWLMVYILKLYCISSIFFSLLLPIITLVTASAHLLTILVAVISK